MRKWISLSSISAVVAVLVFCSNKPASGDEPLLKRLLFTLSTEHYSPKEIDDSLSLKIYHNFLDKIDGDKQFFTKEDIQKFEVYKLSIDDQMKAGRFDFFDTVWTTLSGRLNAIEPWIETATKTPLNYDEKLTYVSREKEKEYVANMSGLKTKWDLWTRFQVVDRLYRKLEQQKELKSGKSDSGVAKSTPFDTLEFKARNETQKYVKDWFKRWRKMDRQDQIAFYANTVAEIYDPHTNYFPPADKENFDISMTGKLEGIGATLTERDGFVKVERIVPGSASYKQGELKAGDLILKVAQGAGEPVDIVDMKLDDAIQLIRGKKGTEVRLTVKKPDGSIHIIPIIRETVVIEESYARSAIFTYKKKKFGIIQLPSFYADFSSRGRGRNSAGDVRIEVEKLKKAGVSGIVLDLRNNGGGSLADAIDMSGLFISQGPIVQVKDPGGNIQQANDPDPQTIYDGPMVVLTNTYSASASEILAAALQDYKRAIIVGTKSTFGKGTVQTMVPLKGGNSAVFPKGFGELKVTIQKFYRINGGTTQLQGVIPDVIVPDIYDEIERGEKELDFHMPFDQIPAASYKSYENKRYKNAIVEGNKSVKGEKYFELVRERSKQIAQMRDEMTYNLWLDGYKEQQEQLKKQDQKFKDFKYEKKIDSAFALDVDLKEVKGDTIKTKVRETWMKSYNKDAYIDIASKILYQWSCR